MTLEGENRITTALCFTLCVVAILGILWITKEATDVVSATRVAHDETRVELAECRKQVN